MIRTRSVPFVVPKPLFQKRMGFQNSRRNGQMRDQFDLSDKAAVLREIRDRVVHFYGRNDGSIDFPNSCEGDLIKLAYRAAQLAEKDEN